MNPTASTDQPEKWSTLRLVETIKARDSEIRQLRAEVKNLQFIITRSAELLQKGHRDEVEQYLVSASGRD